jgi:hypothetical protein
LRMGGFGGSLYTGCGAAALDGASAGGGAEAAGIGLGFATIGALTNGTGAGADTGIGGGCVIFTARLPARQAPTSSKPMCSGFIGTL